MSPWDPSEGVVSIVYRPLGGESREWRSPRLTLEEATALYRLLSEPEAFEIARVDLDEIEHGWQDSLRRLETCRP